MRTTLDIDDALLIEAKKRAAERGIPLRRLVEEFIASGLTDRQQEGRCALQWRTTKGSAARGIDFADRDHLYEAMEESLKYANQEDGAGYSKNNVKESTKDDS